MDIQRAEAFCRSYDSAMRAYDAKALVSHYGEPYASFTLGAQHAFATRAVALDRVADHLARLKARGLEDIRLKRFEVVPVSDAAALCHLTWEVHPKDGAPGWSWLNVYGLRQDAKGERFELVVSDNEIAALLKRHPDFFG